MVYLEKSMILIGLGSNLTGGQFDSPRAVLEAALAKMSDRGIVVKKLSRFYQSEPVPISDQPWFVNAVAAVETELSPTDLLQELHEIESSLGRERRVRWEARVLDLDILAYHERIMPSPEVWLARHRQISAENVAPEEIVIPHPRLHERLFVLKPLMDIFPNWRHPVLAKTAREFTASVEDDAVQGDVRAIY